MCNNSPSAAQTLCLTSEQRSARDTGRKAWRGDTGLPHQAGTRLLLLSQLKDVLLDG